jgi:hypothetical protein
MTGVPARWSPRFRLRSSGTTAPVWEATLAVSGYTPPSPRHDSANHILRRRYPSRRAAGVAGDVRAWGVRRVAVRTLPQIQSAHAALAHSQVGRNTRPAPPPASAGLVANFRHLSCSPARSCESAKLGDDGQLLGEGGNGSGSRRCAHEVWWAPACVGRLKVGRVLLWEAGGGRDWYRQSDPSPQI